MTVVAIDGPAGAGKSTVAKTVANDLGWPYVDTGAMYRAVALAALERGVDVHDGDAVATMARGRNISFSDGRLLLDGRDVGDEIRKERVTTAVSVVSAHPGVRSALLSLQRAAASGADVVMEGRDIGTSVFPHAEVKVWLTASSKERARRRLEQMGSAAGSDEIAAMEKAIIERDRRDSSRDTSPMSQPPDAVVIDTTDMSVAGVTEAITKLVGERTNVR